MWTRVTCDIMGVKNEIADGDHRVGCGESSQAKAIGGVEGATRRGETRELRRLALQPTLISTSSVNAKTGNTIRHEPFDECLHSRIVPRCTSDSVLAGWLGGAQ
eukprot:scaffold260565_cov32-Tisochrysis_lutea.AAC.3